MKTLTRTWQWELPHSPRDLWPLLSDTARYNEVMGVPKHLISERLDADGRVRFFGSVRYGPFTLEWEDTPVNWVLNQWHEHRRSFATGPFRLFSAGLTLEPTSAGSVCRYSVALEPGHAIGWIFCRLFLRATRAKIGEVIGDASRYLEQTAERPFTYQAPAIAASVQQRVQRMVAALDESPYGHGLADRLARFVLSAQEVDLVRIRPLALARDWDVKPRQAVEVSLAAASEGLLATRWEILCPRCRLGKVSVASLRELPREAHCTSCNIRYDRDFSNNVELVFRPAAAIREVERGEFCWLGPRNTPHVVVQLTLAPGESRRIAGALPAGEYRARTLEAGAQSDFHWDGSGLPGVCVDQDGVCADWRARPGEHGFENRGVAVRTVIIEQREWTRDALTARQVTTLQVFDALFSDDVLRPGDDVAVEHIVFMFTDLKGSTALYNEVGDARAYRVVREHFALLEEVVRAHDGAIVKLIGDGMHAAFIDPGNAIRCALAIQRRVTAFNRRSELEDMCIRIGLHCGPSISVTINQRLDYYGATVNMAARLEGQAGGGEVVMSETFARDPAVAEALEGFSVEQSAAPLKGFEGETSLYRLSAREIGSGSD